MKSLQDNLSYYERQKQEIIKNKVSYQSVRHYNEYGGWQQGSYTFSGHTILSEHGTNWWYSIKWGKGRFGHHMKSDGATQDSVRHAIAQKLGKPLDEISPYLVINARGEDPTHWFAEKSKMFNTYTIGYQYRNLFQREERFFDQAKYEQALRECEQNIASTRETMIEVQKQEQLQQQINRADQQIAGVKAEAANVAAKISAANALRVEYERKCALLEVANKQKQELVDQQKEQIYKALQNADSQQRAFFIAGLWGAEGSEATINYIKSLGFDANQLAHHAIVKNHSALFDLALQSGANCTDYFIGSKTLLQNIIQGDKEVLLQKVLAKGQDLTSTLITAVAQEDMATLNKLLSNNPGLIKQKYAGYSLLQIAISAEESHIGVIRKILELDSKSAEILSNNGESALKIAARRGTEEVVQLVSQHANLEIELEQLGAKVDASAKAEILASNNLQRVIELFREETALAEEHDEHKASDEAELFAFEELVTQTESSLHDVNIGLQGLGLDDHNADHLNI